MGRLHPFPAEIFLTVEEEGTENEFFLVHMDTTSTAEIGKERHVGRYMLDETLRIGTKIVLLGTK